MKFGKVDNPEEIDFTLPKDHLRTSNVFSKIKNKEKPTFYIGCAKWNRTDLKGFYPRGTKDELEYYSGQFNSIELNASFYRIFPSSTYESWYNKTPDDFRFFPKMFQGVTHWKRLNDFEAYLEEYLINTSLLKEKMEMGFVQMHGTFAPKNMDRLEPFFKAMPKDFPFAVEFRHKDWFSDPSVSNELFDLMEKHNVTNVLVDTAGRRDLMHMCATSDAMFIRYNGSNHESDYKRLDDWVDRIEVWVEQGLRKIYFFVHQNIEKASPLLSAYFIQKINDRFDLNLQLPKTPDSPSLF